MRVLIVGAVGQLARALLPRFVAAGHAASAAGRPTLDLREPGTVRAALAALRPELVVNAAAYTAVDRAEDEPALAFAVNRDGPALLAAETAAAGIPLVHVSTDYVFDGAGGAPYVEDAPTNPAGVYGRSKRDGETAALAANPRTMVLRTAWLCSPDGSNFLRTMLRLASERDEVGVVADQRGAPTFAADLADAVVAMAPRLVAAPAGDPAFGVFHLTGMPWTTWHGFAAAIFEGAAARGRRVPRLRAITTAEYPTRARRPADGRLDCGAIAQVHAIEAADWRTSLLRCLDQLLGPEKRPGAP